MSFLENVFGKKKRGESVVLVDVSADSVAGAYAYGTADELPAVLYTRRLPVEARSGEAQEVAMLRALRILGDTLIREGAPVLARVSGSGAVGSIIVSIDAPWQKISVRTEHIEQKTPFLFTKSLVNDTLKEAVSQTPGKLLVDESIIGTILNGYETREPYGKEVHRAAIIILTSLIDEHVAKGVATVLRGVFHTENILPIAGGSLRYQAMREAFPHERDALIIDAMGRMTFISLVRRGLIVDTTEIPNADTAKALVGHIRDELAELGGRYPLPRTIFLLARETDATSLCEKLGAAKLEERWLSDNPPTIIPVLASHIVGLVRQSAAAAPDILLLLMALYWHRSLKGED